MESIEGLSLALFPVESARSEPDVADLVQAHSAMLFRVAHSVLRSRVDAEDVVQDTFVRVLEYRRPLSEVRDMRVWLIRITWNLALDRRRRIRPEQMDSLFAEGLATGSVPADQALVVTERIRAVMMEMERLPKGERHALLLSALEELDTAEMAAILGKSESAVRALVFRARSRLRKRMERREGA